jgi:DNA (cytosine-5)-methyltransferase 1
VVFVGVRDDLGLDPVFPTPLPYRYSIRDALPNLTGYRFDTSGARQAASDVRDVDAPAQTVNVSGNAGGAWHHKVDGEPLEELVALGTSKGEVALDAPAPTVLTHGRRHTQSELSAVVHRPPEDHDTLYVERGPAPDAYRVEASLDDPSPTVAASGIGNAREYQASLPGEAPPLEEFDPENKQRIDLDGTALAGEWDKLDPGQQSDRYFSLVRPHPDEPIPTVTATAYHRGTAGVTHPTERRKLTLAELRRLCSFPDDFVLPGSYQDGWTRLGNAVPPVMMRHVAEALLEVLT